MTILPDWEIQNYCEEHSLISPFNSSQLQPASYDVRLGSTLLVRSSLPGAVRTIDIREKPSPERFKEIDISSGYALLGFQFILGATKERVCIPDYLVGRIEGKSSRARLGLQIHSAGYLDPGFRGNVTLELVNFSPDRIILYPGVLIAQLSFEYLTRSCRIPYNSERNHYQDSIGPVASRFGDNE